MSELAQEEAGELQGARRYVTLLFSDLCDYTTLGESIEPDEVDRVNQQIGVLAERIVARHGGSIIQVYGDGLLAVFGLPTTGEDDGRHAVEAALELHRALRERNFGVQLPPDFELRMHSGVHAGMVFVREGDALHGRFGLTGDAVNTTSRLCGQAGRDQILVSGLVLHGIEGFFNTEAIELNLKGKREPLRVHRVSGRSGVRTRFEARTYGGLTTFINRERELGELANWLREAEGGAGRITVVVGPPGIGKTRLLEEFSRRASGAEYRLLRGTCEGYGELQPLEPFRQALRQLLGLPSGASSDEAARAVHALLETLDRGLEPYADTLLQLLSLRSPLDATTLGEQSLPVVPALRSLFEAAAARTAMLILFDDWQWADQVSREVLEQVCTAIEGRRIFILVGMRTAERSEYLLRRASVIHLQPLGEGESGRVIQALRPHALGLDVARVLHRHAGGNPLFLEELCHCLPEPVLVGERALEAREIPNTVQGLIHARFARMPPDEVHVLRAAAVIGMEFGYSLLAQLVDEETLQRTLPVLAPGDMIHAVGPGVYRFKHGITREVIYESIRVAERARLHRTLARAIEHETSTGDIMEQAEALAYHYRASNEPQHAADYSELAGDKAMLTWSIDRASMQYSAALRELDKLAPTPELKQRWLATFHKWASAFIYNPDPKLNAPIRKAGLYAKDLGDMPGQIKAEYWQGWIDYVLGEYGSSIDHHCRALEWVGGGQRPHKMLAQLWSSLGQTYAAAGRDDEALASLERGLALKRSIGQTRKGRSVAEGFGYAASSKALLHARRGEFEIAHQAIEEAVATVQGTGHAVEGSVRAMQSLAQLMEGDFEASLESSRLARGIAERINGEFTFAMSTMFECFARAKLGAGPDALGAAHAALQWLEARGTRMFISINFAWYADVLADAGDLQQARTYALRALTRVEQHDPLGEPLAYRVLARVYAQQAEAGRARVDECIAKAFACSEARGWKRELSLTRLLAAELHDGRPEHPARFELAQQALAEFEQMGMRWHAARAAQLLRGS